VTVKVRFGDFATRTRSRTSPLGLDSGPVIAAMASELLGEVDVGPGVRLLGVGVSNLGPSGSGPGEQMALDLAGTAAGSAAGPSGPSAPPPARQSDASGAVDDVRRRFGRGAVGPAALLDGGRLRVKRPGDTQWGPRDE
jgi:DNA polymerase-4